MNVKKNGIVFYGRLAELNSEISSEEWDFYNYTDEISDQIYALMERKKINKAELARRLGKSRAYVSKVLCGEANITIKTLAKILNALGAKVEFKIVDKNEPINWLGLVKKTHRYDISTKNYSKYHVRKDKRIVSKEPIAA
jgi:transcriptional regulator with XRE-family HTH domain